MVGIDPSVFHLGYFPSSVTVASSTYLIIGWFTMTRNRSAASLVLWGTPPFIYTQDDMMSMILTLYYLLVRKDATHLTKQPCTPRSCMYIIIGAADGSLLFISSSHMHTHTHTHTHTHICTYVHT